MSKQKIKHKTLLLERIREKQDGNFSFIIKIIVSQVKRSYISLIATLLGKLLLSKKGSLPGLFAYYMSSQILITK